MYFRLYLKNIAFHRIVCIYICLNFWIFLLSQFFTLKVVFVIPRIIFMSFCRLSFCLPVLFFWLSISLYCCQYKISIYVCMSLSLLVYFFVPIDSWSCFFTITDASCSIERMFRVFLLLMVCVGWSTSMNLTVGLDWDTDNEQGKRRL